MSQEVRRDNKVYRCWTFTANNYTEADIKLLRDWDLLYACWGKEKGRAGTEHLQGFIKWKRGYRFTQITKLRASWHWEPAKAKDAQNYCMKDGEYEIRDEAKGQGKRCDFDEALKLIHDCTTRREMVTHPKLFAIYAKYPKWCDLQFLYRPSKPIDTSTILWRPWQASLLEMIKKSPDSRKIHWYYDANGGQGKSFMTRILMRNYQAFLADGKKADTLYAYHALLSSIVIFDLTRSQDGEFTPYSTMETLKNGHYLSTKYESVNVSRDGECHLIVFANFLPDRTKLSNDRWDVHILGGGFQ